MTDVQPLITGSGQPAVTRSVEEWIAEAMSLEQAGRPDDAEQIIAFVLREKPDDVQALFQASLLSCKRKQMPQAIERLQRALTLAPDEPRLHRNMCELCRSQLQLDKALFHGQRAVELAPDDANTHYNLGVVHYDRMEIEAAIVCARRALALDPTMASAHFELAEALLLNGAFAEGWEEYEWRFDMPNSPQLLPPTHRPLWDGTPMPNGTLLLIGDQGFGDTIQFCRYIPEAAARCPNIIMACSAEMKPIVMQQKSGMQYVDRWDQVPTFDAYCPLSGLPRLFKTDLNAIPTPIPYLRPEAAKLAYWRARLEQLIPRGYQSVGIAWAGRPTHGNDYNRSMALRDLAPLSQLNNTVLVSLQMGPAIAQISDYYGAAPLINLGTEIADFTDTMAILAVIDHMVAVDTSIVHLAGAMGRPVSVLLPFAPDWRWLRDRNDSPWYPSVQLFRQRKSGVWSEPVHAIAHSLQASTRS
ncbi:tetratricopeptide repeat protein [Rhizobium oryziradicis]|uniref:tetratricopeptide repeat protein n=1 Tax=Rhizobium oryziradicis TaxID=1867956 RepID=UPI0009F8A3EC|nr:tetratricopeptide repeat protein [Rhizobium oryziradicis]